MAVPKRPENAVCMSGPIFVACDQPGRFIATPAAGGPWTVSHWSGIAADLSFLDWTYPSLDLSVGFVRPPEGGWILLESHCLPHVGGRTVCVTALSDCLGPFAQATQTLMIDRRVAQA